MVPRGIQGTAKDADVPVAVGAIAARQLLPAALDQEFKMLVSVPSQPNFNTGR